MYEGDTFEAVVENIESDITSLNVDSTSISIEQREDGLRNVTIHVSETEGPDYFIEGSEGERFFYIKSYYNLIVDLTATLSVDRIRERREESSFEYDDEELSVYLPPGATIVSEHADATWPKNKQSDTGEGTDEASDELDKDTDSENIRVWRDRIAAALDVVDSVSEEDEQEIVFNLVDIFSNVPVKFRVNSTSNGGLSGLIVRERIFPYEEDFNIKSLDKSIVRTRIPANMGMLFFQYVYDLNIRQDKEGTVAETPPERPNIPL